MATYDQQTRQIERRRQLAQMLMQQANAQPQQQGGRFYVGPTPFSALGRLASGVGGAYMEHKADQDQVAAEDAERKRLTEALGQMRGGGAQPQQQGPASASPSGLVDTGDPAAREHAATQLLQGLPLDQYRQIVSGQGLQALFPKLERVDLGNEIGMVDANGNVVQRIAKGVSPEAAMREEGERYRFDNPSGSARLSADTARRGQDLSAQLGMRGQDVTMRGQDLSAETARRGQDVLQQRADAILTQKQDQKSADLNSAWNLYETARDGLMTSLEGSATGPVAGRIPAFTAAQQTAEGGVSAMAPVLKQLFRVAGEGTFTDRDQALLLEMVPTRADRPEARGAKIKNIDAIVRAKLGVAPSQAVTTPGLDDIMGHYLSGGGR